MVAFDQLEAMEDILERESEDEREVEAEKAAAASRRNSKTWAKMQGSSKKLPLPLPPVKIILPPTCNKQSKSGVIDFHRSEAPYFKRKTITATPKSYVTGEHIIIAILQPSEDLYSTQVSGNEPPNSCTAFQP